MTSSGFVLVHDCRAFTGEPPSRFLAQLAVLPEFHTLFATEDRLRHNGVRDPDSRWLKGLPKFTITLEAFPYPRESNRGSVEVAPGRATFSAARAPRHSPDAPGPRSVHSSLFGRSNRTTA